MHKIEFGLLWLLVLFTVWFPKAGIKIDEIPLTVGSVLLVALLALEVVLFLGGKRIFFDRIGVLLVLGCTYFGIRTLVGLSETSEFVAYFAALALYPLCYLLIKNIVKSPDEYQSLLALMRNGFFFISIYGLLQLLLGVNAVAIPGLTVNLSDYQSGADWYLQKHNGDSESLKLISTYQNGNLFGVNLLVVGIFVYETSQRRLRPWVLLSIVVLGALTLSRTVWVGVAVYVIWRFLMPNSASRLSIGSRVFAASGVVIALICAFNWFPQIAARVSNMSVADWVDATGRTPGAIEMFRSIEHNPLAMVFGPFGWFKFDGFAYEMTYFAVIMVGGFLGLLFFLMPLVASFMRFVANRGLAEPRGAAYALLVWAVVAVVEGGYWLPPTAMVLWIVISLAENCPRVPSDLQNCSVVPGSDGSCISGDVTVNSSSFLAVPATAFGKRVRRVRS